MLCMAYVTTLRMLQATLSMCAKKDELTGVLGSNEMYSVAPLSSTSITLEAVAGCKGLLMAADV